MKKDIKDDYYIFNSKLSDERIKTAYERVVEILPGFKQGERVSLGDLKIFLSKKYKATEADYKDIDKCTHTKVKRYNKYCKDAFCVSEGHVISEEYVCSYIIKRENTKNVSKNKDDFFYDLFVIVGSEDAKRLSSYYIGGYSEGFAEEMYVLCGNA